MGALSFPATPTAAAATSVTLPTHAVGDLLLIWAYIDGSTTAPTPPAAAGTVPTWLGLTTAAGANTNAASVYYCIATATNHTSGTWVTPTGMCAVSLRGQAPQWQGGFGQAGGTGANTCTTPAITMSSTSGTSLLISFGGTRNVTAWNAVGGWTLQASVATEVAVYTKNSATSDGSTALAPTNSVSGSGYRAQQIEVLANNVIPLIAPKYEPAGWPE